MSRRRRRPSRDIWRQPPPPPRPPFDFESQEPSPAVEEPVAASPAAPDDDLAESDVGDAYRGRHAARRTPLWRKLRRARSPRHVVAPPQEGPIPGPEVAEEVAEEEPSVAAEPGAARGRHLLDDPAALQEEEAGDDESPELEPRLEPELSEPEPPAGGRHLDRRRRILLPGLRQRSGRHSPAAHAAAVAAAARAADQETVARLKGRLAEREEETRQAQEAEAEAAVATEPPGVGAFQNAAREAPAPVAAPAADFVDLEPQPDEEEALVPGPVDDHPVDADMAMERPEDAPAVGTRGVGDDAPAEVFDSSAGAAAMWTVDGRLFRPPAGGVEDPVQVEPEVDAEAASAEDIATIGERSELESPAAAAEEDDADEWNEAPEERDRDPGEGQLELALAGAREAPPGRRRRALEERKKRRRRRSMALGAVAATLAVVTTAGVIAVAVTEEDPRRERERRGGAAVVEQEPTTTLVFGTRERRAEDEGALWLVLLSHDPAGDEAAVIYVPARTAVEVPGRGLQGLGDAYAAGGVPLLLVSAENLLGVRIDRYVELSDSDARVLFHATGPLSVDVPSEVTVEAGRDESRMIFAEGPQELTPPFLVRLLYTRGLDADDLEFGSRHLAFWDALLEEFAGDREGLAQAVRQAGAALTESDANVEAHAEFFEALATVPEEDMTLTILPVRAVSAGDSELYAADEEELAAFIQENLPRETTTGAEVRVQVLNGNGVPGIGEEVAAKLVGEGFRVILSGNARRLDYKKTLIVTYDTSAQGQELAERARDVLGVGRVRVSEGQQGIVDLTIVVGKDFLRTL